MDFTPAIAERSLRFHGARIALHVRGAVPGPPQMITFGAPVPRTELMGPGPETTVMRSAHDVGRVRVRCTCRTPSLIIAMSTSRMPMRSSENWRRTRWRVSAKASPLRTAKVSKTPSPTVKP